MVNQGWRWILCITEAALGRLCGGDIHMSGAHVAVPGARHWPLAALVLASALWGGAIAGTKYALRAFDPVTLLSVELVAATAALWGVLLIRGYRPPPSWPVAVLLGLLEPALAYLGDTFGLSLTSAADGAIISGLESAVVVILAAFVLGEAVSRAAAVAAVNCQVVSESASRSPAKRLATTL
jgi:hypothetical protein